MEDGNDGTAVESDLRQLAAVRRPNEVKPALGLLGTARDEYAGSMERASVG
jgi:hypothetical protein